MIPILFDENETSFTSNGIGRLALCLECLTTEQRNGIYEVEFKYPVTGRRYSDIQIGRYIAVTHDDSGDVQPFEIYKRTAPIDGIVTFNARHISYKLNNVILNPFTATTITEVMARIPAMSINSNPFAFWTDKSTAASFKLEEPASVRSILGGTEGSLLDVFGGGEYLFDKFDVKLYQHRGRDTGYTIRYGKNLTDLKQTVDQSNAYNAVVPFWAGESDGTKTLVILDERIVTAEGVTNPVPVIMDMTSEFQNPPTQSQLRTKAKAYLNNNKPWIPSENIKIDFVALWQTDEYKNVANLQRLRLCDTVNVYHTKLGVTAENVKIVKTVYNVLTERYEEMELGDARTNFGSAIKADYEKQITKTVASMQSFMDAAIADVTASITGGKGGHVVLGLNAKGKPEEILIMDTEDKATATNIIRLNVNGIGFSTDGGATYRTAWTIDGKFVADFITAGTLNANLIRAGIITDAQGTNYWNLDTGELRITGNTRVGSGTLDSALEGATNNAKTYSDSKLAQYAVQVDAIVADLQDQIDGQIESWYYDYEPTLSNAPASSWTTETDRKAHEGDTFYWESTGYAYRFTKINGTWQWKLIEDSQITQAIAMARAAQETADVKRRVFVSQPTPPYDIGDLWVQGGSGEIMKCRAARASGSYTASDWEIASKYTDDTAVNNLQIGGKNMLTGTNTTTKLTSTGTWADRTWRKAGAGTGTITHADITDAPDKSLVNGWEIDVTSVESTAFGQSLSIGQNRVKVVAGEQYTMSCWAKGSGRLFIFCGITAYHGGRFDVESDWKKYSVTFTVNNSTAYVNENGANAFFGASANGSSVTICGMQLEKGGKATDWTPAPEDVAAEIDAAKKALSDWINGDFTDTINELQEGITDAKVETYYQNTDPSTNWSTSEKPKHAGDIWYDSRQTVEKYYRWSGFAWQEMKAAPPAAIMDQIDGKATIYTGTSTPSDPQTGDLWFKGRNEPILTYVGGKWIEYNKYTDDTSLNTFLTGTYADDLVAIRGQIDGKAETWYQKENPAAQWSDPMSHKGDLWYDTETHKTYRYSGTAWVEQMVPYEVFDKIDGKAQVFSTTPTPPYAIGDLWVEGPTGDIKRCIVTRKTGSYNTSDWALASKYTDDSALNEFINGSFASTVTEIKGQIDGKAETFYQNSDPSTTWTTADDKAAHKGDIWFCTATTGTYMQKTWQWSGSAWQEMTATPPDEVFDQIDGKAQIFVSQPKPPYDIGDLWVQGSTGDILKCKTKRTSGNYTASDWEKASKYTDDSAVNALNNALTQQEIFNRLTNNGKTQGIYIQNGLLYINATYIKSGTLSANLIKGGILKLGGASNGNGTIEIYNASGEKIGTINNAGAAITGDLTIQKTISSIIYKLFAGTVSASYKGTAFSRGGVEVSATSGSNTGRIVLLPAPEKGKYRDNKRNYMNFLYTDRPLIISAKNAGAGNAEWTSVELGDGEVAIVVGKTGTQDTSFRTYFDSNGNLSTSIGLAGELWFGGDIHTILSNSTTKSANVCNTNGKLCYTTSSSKRYKRDISDEIPEALDPEKLYNLKVKTYVYRDEYLSKEDHNYGKRMIGFIAEDVDEIYPIGCQYDEDKRPEMWNNNIIVPAMLKLIQNQKKQIDELEARITRLEALILKEG